MPGPVPSRFPLRGGRVRRPVSDLGTNGVLRVRLTHIKLAGFKSFVDPTHLALPGQLIGVVGPNGCGKSNVIDAVRWVLGESSAKHLRGETMQDVIFNGSGERKPVNRASVELVFDNSLGKAAGPWSQFAEISIKRVLERQGDSSYYINNIPVRRRDVADIFLGTGLGARAYAIIEQGMISRIVEAKPEELRVFLEEAAGVSKYRERRKETESRLDDARENLLRVEDIRQELGSQITHLEGQAQAAERYRSLEGEIRQNQWVLWAVRRRDAGAQRTRLSNEVDQLTLDLERTTAELRETESRVETLRTSHYAASDAVHTAQGGLYEANAELARVEQQLQFLRSQRQRTEARLRELTGQIERDAERLAALETEREDVDRGRDDAEDSLAQCEAALESARDGLPDADTAYREARSRLEQDRQSLSEAQRSREVAVTRRDQVDRLLSQLGARRDRLSQERASLVVPDTEGLEILRAECDAVIEELEAIQREREGLEESIPRLEEAFRETSKAVEAARQNVASLEARRHALVALQEKVGTSEQMSAWLSQHGLAAQQRLWEKIHVRAGWEDAVEAVLRERLNAVAIDDPARLTDWFGGSPPGKLAVYRPDSTKAGFAGPLPAGCLRLTECVTCDDPAVAPAVTEWLANVFAAQDAPTALAAVAELPAGGRVVTPEGHVFMAHSVGFHAPDSEIHGLLERKQEIEGLSAEIPQANAELEARRTDRTEAELRLGEGRAALDRARNRLSELAQRRHATELDLMKATQALERARDRQRQIEHELAEVFEAHARELELREANESEVVSLDGRLDALREAAQRANERFHASEDALNTARMRANEAERRLQEAQFAVRGIEARRGEIERAVGTLSEQLAQGRIAAERTESELQGFEDGALSESLAACLAVKEERERTLGVCRDTLAEAERELRAADETRTRLERQLDPLRNRIGDLRLKEQEARLAEEGFAQQLAEARLDEARIAELLDKPPRPGALQGEISRLQEELTALGAVNLAALDELQKATDRKTFLDAQWSDLTEAVNTLEDAIRRIDRETRERLKGTFDEVNKNLAEMFPQLFGGGEAKLVMTGEEILDSGVQIIARPPGKKNASIHLLSGGEKALTAVSLVFSLFRLNPAPFCLLDEVDAPLDDSNTGRFCQLVKKMSEHTQFIFISHNKITMEMAEQLIGVTMPELGASKIVAVDIQEALRLQEEVAA